MCKCSCPVHPDRWWWCLPSELVVGFIWLHQSLLLQKRKLAQASMGHLPPAQLGSHHRSRQSQSLEMMLNYPAFPGEYINLCLMSLHKCSGLENNKKMSLKNNHIFLHFCCFYYLLRTRPKIDSWASSIFSRTQTEHHLYTTLLSGENLESWLLNLKSWVISMCTSLWFHLSLIHRFSDPATVSQPLTSHPNTKGPLEHLNQRHSGL